jgi:phosphate transport system substrate-binding protein
MRNRAHLGPFIVVAFWVLGFQCQQLPAEHNPERPDPNALRSRVNGAGSQAVEPLVRVWIDEYGRQHPGTHISYQAIGSKAALRMLTVGSTFGAIDVPVSDDQSTPENGRLLQFPVTVTAVVPVYNLPGVKELRFSGSTLAGIFLGKITNWNDSAIVKDNPGIDLPRLAIKVKHYFPRGSAETYVMADYLSKVSSDFKITLAASPNNWPLASIEYKGAEGTAGFVSHTPGSIGYLGLVPARLYEQQGSLNCAAVQNSDGGFVTASPESLAAASRSAAPSVQASVTDFRLSITNAPGKTSYPIASFIWFVLYEKPQKSPDERKKSEVTKDFLKWVLTDGQESALKLGYPALPKDLVQMELKRLS